MEKNRKIMDNALERLGCFKPKDEVWEKIDSYLQQEYFEDSLAQINSFDPPEKIWGQIAQELSKQEKLGQLRKFTPDAASWDIIEKQLNSADSKTINTKIFRFATLAAAAVALILITYFMLFSVSNKTNISYSEELIILDNTNEWQDNNKEMTRVLHDLCASNPMACSTSDIKTIEKELTYLNERKAEILSRMNIYDENTHLQVILTRLELEKSEIVKEMISKILDRS